MILTVAGAPRIVLYPGMGSDARMYDQLAAFIPGIERPPWLEPGPREPLREYALRCARSLALGPDAVIGGSSFGGMLALEIAKTVRVRGVALIGSCRHPAQVAWWFRSLEPLRLVMPSRFLTARLPVSVFCRYALGIHDPAVRALHVEMVRSVGAGFMRWAAWASVRWEGAGDLAVPIAQIHGSSDRLMPAGRTCAQRIIPSAPHVLALTHAREIATWLAEVAGSTPSAALRC